jgi:hypothetical protein
MNNNKKGEITKEFNLDQVLLTEGEVNKGPKRPPRKNSVRMSIFIRNMNKVDTVSTSKLMKVKKKEKKIYINCFCFVYIFFYVLFDYLFV